MPASPETILAALLAQELRLKNEFEALCAKANKTPGRGASLKYREIMDAAAETFSRYSAAGAAIENTRKAFGL